MLKTKILMSLMFIVLFALISGCQVTTQSTAATTSTTATTTTTTATTITTATTATTATTVTTGTTGTTLSIGDLPTPYTDALKLTKSYAGKEFIKDGIGQVTLSRCVDGDTDVFISNNVSFTVRFLGIDTPESTAEVDPWGKAASQFTCDKLTDAKTIVLEREGEVMDSYGSRYLAWVWYDDKDDNGADLRLLNLELVEEAYSMAKGLSGSEYAPEFYQADLATEKTGRRIWGEKDPNYDYTNTPVEVTLQQLRDNQAQYLGKQVLVTGTITRILAGSTYGMYMEQDGYSAYVFVGYTKLYDSAGYLVKEGDLVKLQVTDENYNGLLELSNTYASKTDILSSGNTVTPQVITVDQINEELESDLVEIDNLVVNSIHTSSSAFTVYAKDSSGREVEIRVDNLLYPKVSPTLFTAGKQFNIIGNISEYTLPTDTTPGYQLTLAKLSDVTFLN